MEMMIMTLLVVIAIIAIRSNSEISRIKFQNESMRQDIIKLREAIEGHPAEPSESRPQTDPAPETDTASEAYTTPETDTENETVTSSAPETESPTAAIVPPEPPVCLIEQTDSHQEEEKAAENMEIHGEGAEIQDRTDTPKSGNWEKFIGVNLFSKIGILILIVGIGFFVKYAIDRNWINEVTRTVLGMCVGFSLWGIAYRIRDEYRNFSSILAGGGFAICFVCIAIAFHLYGMFPATTTFVLLIALTAAMIAISLRFDRPELAIVSIAGGFIAPFIASDGSGSFMFVLGYMAVLNTAMFAVTLYKNWWTLPVVSCFATYIICSGAWLCGELGENSGVKFAVITYYFILFSIPLVTVMRRNATRSGIIAWLVSASAFNSLCYLTIGGFLAANSFPPVFYGLPGLTGAAVNFAIYLRYYMRREEGPAANLLLTLIAGFALATFLLQFTNPGIYIAAIGIEATILSWLYFRSGRRIFRTLALLIGIPFTVILLLSFVFFGPGSDDSGLRTAWGYIVTGGAYLWSAYIALTSPRGSEMRDYTILSTGALWAGGALSVIGGYVVFSHYLPAAATGGCTLLLAAAVMLGTVTATRTYSLTSIYIVFPGLAALMLAACATPEEGKGLVNIPLVFSWVVFAAMYLRCAIDVFDHRAAGADSRSKGVYMVYFNIAVSVFAVTAAVQLLHILGLCHIKSAGVSVALTGCAAVQMILGMRRHNKLLRIIALCVFGIVIGKLMIYDLWKMAAVGRIVVFILLGAILLSVSFLYQRLRGVLLDDGSRGESHSAGKNEGNG